MGTDIRCYAERRVNGKWELCEPLVPNPDYYPADPSDPPYADDASEPEFKPQEIYDERNYSVFAIIADIRNGSHSDEDYESIAPQRGLPEDISNELAEWANYWAQYAYGFTWCSFAELLNFPWKQKSIKKKAMVDPRAAYLFNNGSDSFPHLLWPRDVRKEYAGYMKGGVTVTWRATYEESAGSYFLVNTFEKLASFGKPEDVRLVMWFD